MKEDKRLIFEDDASWIEEGRQKQAAAGLSIASNTLLVLLKLAVGVWTASIGVLSEAVHSAIDLVAAIIAAIAVRRSGKPADSSHPFGHGKFENISGAVEALLIFAAAAWIVRESVLKLMGGGGDLVFVEAALGVMAVSAVANVIVSSRLMKVARKTDSIALEADAVHLRVDVYTSGGVFIALGIIYASDFFIDDPVLKSRIHLLDPIIALGVAAMILHAAWTLTARSVAGLLDHTLPDEEEDLIREILTKHSGDFLEFHKLRTRKSGSERHVDLHLVVYRRMEVGAVHELCDHIEDEIREALPRTKVLIHVEPCKKDCPVCRLRETCEEPEKRISRP